MIKIVDGNIYLTRGDSAILELTILDEDGQTWTPAEGDKVIFCMKKAAINPAVLLKIEAVSGSTDIIINPEDTKELTPGQYIYDIHAELAGGDVYTVIADKIFEVGKEAHTEWS